MKRYRLEYFDKSGKYTVVYMNCDSCTMQDILDSLIENENYCNLSIEEC